MELPKALSILIVVIAVSAGSWMYAQQNRGPSGALSAQDYVEIQQLSVRYARGFDSGAGELFARAFTQDAVLTLGKNVIEGRQKLAEFASQPGADKGPTNVFHLISNVLIEPTGDGASGVAYLVLVNLGQAGTGSTVRGGGIYQDVYVKGREGWRIKRRNYLPAHSVPGPKPAQPPA